MAAFRFGVFRAAGELLGKIVRLRVAVGGMRRALGAFAVEFAGREFGIEVGLTGRLVTVCGPFEVTGAEFDGADE